MLYFQTISSSYLQGCSEDLGKEFWEEWQQHKDHLHICCIKWIGDKPTDVEDVLSQAMLKACNQWQKERGKIQYPKAWFTRIVHNLCMDAHRKSKREAQVIENIDDLKFEDCSSFCSSVDFPECNILALEMREYIRHKIESLPTRLRDTFVLYYCQEKSYKDIAKQLACSEENVRKCLIKARKILQRHLNKYLFGEDDTSLDSPSSPLKLRTCLEEESQLERHSNKHLKGEDDTSLDSPSSSPKLRICLEEESQLECNWESPITTKSNQEEISYQVTVICLENLSHHWCSSSNLLSCK
jgi:RNA polymerase sigma factor (sigma-70 family)